MDAASQDLKSGWERDSVRVTPEIKPPEVSEDAASQLTGSEIRMGG